MYPKYGRKVSCSSDCEFVLSITPGLIAGGIGVAEQ